ncbi:MAG: protein-export chaperone SecB [Nitrospirota bacterium]
MELKFKISEIKQLESHFALNPDFKSEKDKPIEIGYGINVSFDKRDKMVNVIVSVVSDKKTQPFTFNIATAGLFSFNKLPQKQELEKVAHINCASIVFPYIRESLADLTRRAGFPPFHIDPVNFINIYEQHKKAQTEDAIKKEKAAKA